MAAEAFNKASNDAKARGYLNLIRQRAGLADVSASGTVLFDAIVKERQLELAFEGYRYVDLVRWGLADQELKELGYQQSKHSVLPIPDFDVNTAALPQNPNY